jgi:hypothetical protein
MATVWSKTCSGSNFASVNLIKNMWNKCENGIKAASFYLHMYDGKLKSKVLYFLFGISASYSR